MADTKGGALGHSPGSTAKQTGGRPRVISSCLTCRRRKVKCDHVHPVCGSCTRGNHACTWTDQVPAPTATGRISKSTLATGAKGGRSNDVQARLDRLEYLLEKAVAGQGTNSVSSLRSSVDFERKDTDASTPSSSSQTSQGAGITSDNGDGTLLLNGGQSQFVSSLHFALLADEIQDIKALLGDKTDEEKKEVPQSSLVDLLSLGRAGAGSNLENLLPSTQEHRDILLDVYFTNVDPMVRITHRPTVMRKFFTYNREAHPIAYAIYFSAINSLPPKIVQTRFGDTKEALLDRFQLGVEISLARENYLTTSDLEIFQGFVLWLTCITREEDMGKAWVLVGIAFRIALNQGLHRDPSLFPTGSMDALTIEQRRRMWHQLGHLEFRAAECKGQEPSITEDFYTTLLPRNIDDEELVDGASPGEAPYNEQKFTSMTFQLVRFNGVRALRRIVQSTYRLERRMLDSGLHGTSRPDPAQELRDLYDQIKVMLDQVHEETHRKYLQFLNPEIPMERLTLGLASLLEWRAYLFFWLRMPRAYRDDVFSDDIRRSIFEKSVNCVETINGAAADVDAARFQWHIGAIASFQAIMHILSELRKPLFDAPDRQRALRALQMSRILRANNNAKAWQAVKNMIDKAVAEHTLSPRSQNQPLNPYMSQPTPASATMPGPTSTSTSTSTPVSTPMSATMPTLPLGPMPNSNTGPYQAMGEIPAYAYQPSSMTFNQPTLLPQSQPLPQPPPVQSQPDMMDSTSNFQNRAPVWDDININNINNIVGDMQPTTNVIPEFDFGFWGDPFNYENEPVAMPMQDGYFPQWTAGV
ncbi:hypothetical protein COCCADRAFT_6212 [Bipolaris zeicola 26-R-13]|uniref:Zn(2)-C6 fungal-type domain-containing protein n=1 Tax=Cochliobolus carbonum (strain 26-R-13) TaxID=930089 RepID=W6YKT0_COCC2|nr:uncharacterized protein COCCADRAFT_6212 [Bipolaris zeicola 26-R-13]EUC31976.1 hypothetical protein COCCADRAFT_6212 [Bipolaris zeicola 26-R-13]